MTSPLVVTVVSAMLCILLYFYSVASSTKYENGIQGVLHQGTSTSGVFMICVLGTLVSSFLASKFKLFLFVAVLFAFSTVWTGLTGLFYPDDKDSIGTSNAGDKSILSAIIEVVTAASGLISAIAALISAIKK